MLYVEVEFPTTPADDVRDHLSGPFPLGGEGRYVVAKPVEPVGWPTVDAGDDRALWLLATPGLFGGREAPPPIGPMASSLPRLSERRLPITRMLSRAGTLP